MKAKELPPLSFINQVLRLDESSGLLYWKVNRPRGVKAGDLASRTESGKRYHITCLLGQTYPSHRIIYAIATGESPNVDLEIDHINRDRHDNRPENLRLVTRQENLANVHKRMSRAWQEWIESYI
jgi:hypothetical protein